MTEAPSGRHGRRWACRCCIALSALMLAALGAAVILWSTTETRLAAEMRRLRCAGEPLRVSELVPKVRRGEGHAVSLYEHAFSIEPAGFADAGGRAPKWDDAEAASVRRLVAESQEYFATLERASRTATCAFDKDWDVGPGLKWPELARFRAATRALVAKAEVQRRDGRIDEAMVSCATCLRMADHSAQPATLISYLTSSALQHIAVRELERVFSSGDPSPTACREVYELLGTRTQLAMLTAALRGERAVDLTAFEYAQRPTRADRDRGTSPSGLLVSRYLWGHDTPCYLRMSERNIEAVRKPYAEARQEAKSVEKAVESLPSFSSTMTKMITPAGSVVLWSGYYQIARARAAQVAVATKAYKETHGRYPASLKELARDGWPLPDDPFTNEPYHYAREGDGIAVWSVGPDMRDNHGRALDPKVHRKRDKPGYDYVFQCAR